MRPYLCLATILSALAAFADFSIEDDGQRLHLTENGQPILVYNYAMVDPPAGVDPARWRRASYIHPLYMDGYIITEDFPPDHYHHRGIFWAWPECFAGERKLDVWAIAGIRQVFQHWLEREAGPHAARIGVVNAWKFDGEDKSYIEETIHFTVYPMGPIGRNIDFDLTFQNVSGENVVFEGAINKGYGGFCFRPPAAMKPMFFTTQDGPLRQDALRYATPWADVSFRTRNDGPVIGAAIFQHPANPDYPMDGWLLRHYSFLGAAWPHEHKHTLKPAESFTLKYRLYLHRGDAAAAKTADAHTAYLRETASSTPNTQ